MNQKLGAHAMAAPHEAAMAAHGQDTDVGGEPTSAYAMSMASGEPGATKVLRPWLRPLEWLSALLMLVIIALLFGGVVARYAFAHPLDWVDETVSIAFIWVAMLGSAIAMQRNEHLRLTMFVDMLDERLRPFVHAFALAIVAAFLVAMIGPSIEHARDEWFVTTPTLGIPMTYRVAAIPVGIALMLGIVLTYATRTVPKRHLAIAATVVVGLAVLCYEVSPYLAELGLGNILIFLVGAVAVSLFSGVPIAFCFGIGVVGYLGFSTGAPLAVIVGRMDEGMSNLVLVSVPIFVLLGCVLDATGMGRAIVQFLAALVGHVKAGMSYVLLGSLFIVSGISGSKVSDMATVAPALFPEMTRRGHKRPEMVALLATGAAMADTVPPSIVLIVLGSVAGVSIAGLFQSGFVVAMVLLLTLVVLARWKARHEQTDGSQRAPLRAIGRLMLVALPALALPFLIRSTVGAGIATATEVSTIAVLYAILVGHVLYGGISLRKGYAMLVDTASLSGAILMILGTASAMAWSITQSGVVHAMSDFLSTVPGGAVVFMGLTIVVFLVLGCLLEGLPAVLLLGPIMFPIAKKLGIHDIQYAMVMVSAMNVGLMMPPIGVGFYVACRIGDGRPDDVIRAIWPYLAALLVGVVVIAAVPAISTVAL